MFHLYGPPPARAGCRPFSYRLGLPLLTAPERWAADLVTIDPAQSVMDMNGIGSDWFWILSQRWRFNSPLWPLHGLKVKLSVFEPRVWMCVCVCPDWKRQDTVKLLCGTRGHKFIFQHKWLFQTHLLKFKCLRRQNKLPRDYYYFCVQEGEAGVGFSLSRRLGISIIPLILAHILLCLYRSSPPNCVSI